MKTKKICLILLCTLSSHTVTAAHRRTRDGAGAGAGTGQLTFGTVTPTDVERVLSGAGTSNYHDTTTREHSPAPKTLTARAAAGEFGTRKPHTKASSDGSTGPSGHGAMTAMPTMIDVSVGTSSDYESDSEKPVEFNGKLPDIKNVRGGYIPGTFSSWHFPGVLTAATNESKIDARSAAKAGSELLTNPDRFSTLDGATIAIALKEGEVGMEPAYFGDYSAACRKAKEDKAEEIIERLRVDLEELRLLKNGEVAALEGYSRMNGTGRTSPVGEYGKGTQYENNEVASAQRAIAKAFAITNARQAARDAIAAAEKEAEEAAALDARITSEKTITPKDAESASHTSTEGREPA